MSALGKRSAEKAELKGEPSPKKAKQSDLPPEEQGRPVRVYVDGIWDLFHLGHARALEQAKNIFPGKTFLLVGCCNDELTHKLKGKTVLHDYERYEALRHCRWVDEVVENAPWVITQEFLDKHQIDYVAHGQDPIVDEHGNDLYQFVKDAGKFRVIARTEGISTSDIIMRIVKDYDAYVRRNLARGYSRKEMNVNYFKAKQIEMGQKLDEIKDKISSSVKKVEEDMLQKYKVDFAKWHNIRDYLVHDFVQLFGGQIEGEKLEEGGSSSSAAQEEGSASYSNNDGEEEPWGEDDG